MSFAITVQRSDFQAKWDTDFLSFHNRLLSVMTGLEEQLVARARAKADGGAIAVRSGKFLESIEGKVTSTDGRVSASVWSDTPYSGTIEYGATTGAHDILPGIAKALHFGGSTGEVYAAVVHDPGAHIKAHSVIFAALDEMRDQIISEIEDAASGFDS